MKIIAGCVLIGIPIGIIIFAQVKELGWKGAAFLWICSLIASGMIIGGAYLLSR